MNKYIQLLLILAFFAVSPGVSQDVLDQVAAVVDNEVILDSEVTQMAYMMSMQQGIDPQKNPSRFQEMRKQALESYINRELLLIQADEDTVIANEQQVEAYLEQQLDNVIQQSGGENQLEQRMGMMMSQIRDLYRRRIVKDLRANAIKDSIFLPVRVGRRQAREFFNENKDSLGRMRETIEISHILIEPEPGEKAKMKAMNTAQKLREDIMNGADFSEMAQKHSDDPGSAKQGGDLGFKGRDDFVREYAEAAFNLKPGEISGVVESQFGFHIIKLIERRGEKIHTKHILVSVEPTEEDQRRAAEKIKEIYSMLKNGADFDSLVLEYSDDESTVDDGGYLGEFEVDQLEQMAKEFTFVLSNLQPGEVSEPVKTQYGFHVLKLHDRISARQLSFEEDYDRIKEMVLSYKKQQRLDEWLDEKRDQVYVEYKISSLK
ncbi:MAG: peptidylprolyl isomerase [candidate division KSB1 bacterium]|nr:peptidylprolyl isomerase [candidate division KSB1 bacterium]